VDVGVEILDDVVDTDVDLKVDVDVDVDMDVCEVVGVAMSVEIPEALAQLVMFFTVSPIKLACNDSRKYV
jgi:hypothetical protein